MPAISFLLPCLHSIHNSPHMESPEVYQWADKKGNVVYLYHARAMIVEMYYVTIVLRLVGFVKK